MSGDSKQQLAVLEGLWQWVVENPIKTATSLGGVSYISLWVGYYLFYAEFGVSVQEVGLGYAEILTQAVAYFVVMVIMLFVLIWMLVLIVFSILFALYGIAALVATVLDKLFKSELKSKLESFVSRPSRERTSVWAHAWIRALTVVLALSIVLTVALILMIGVLEGRRSAKAILSGEPLRARAVWDIIPSPYMFRGQKVDVRWIGQTSPMKVGGSLMYLGTAESTSVFYDYKGKKTLRIPSGVILIISPRTEDAVRIPLPR